MSSFNYSRPKWDRASGTVNKDVPPLEIFGFWQTEIYVPPPAENGKVPRNEYGNVELFKEWMLPKGTVHVPLPGLNRVARKLGIDIAPAMIGWEYNRGGCHPMFDGFVVCEEFQETLLDAWNADQVLLSFLYSWLHNFKSPLFSRTNGVKMRRKSVKNAFSRIGSVSSRDCSLERSSRESISNIKRL